MFNKFSYYIISVNQNCFFRKKLAVYIHLYIVKILTRLMKLHTSIFMSLCNRLIAQSNFFKLLPETMPNIVCPIAQEKENQNPCLLENQASDVFVIWYLVVGTWEGTRRAKAALVNHYKLCFGIEFWDKLWISSFNFD